MGAGGSSSKEKRQSFLKSEKQSGIFLLLGTMGVGKSTIAKQMAINFGKGISDGDRLQNRQFIVNNIISSTMTIMKDSEANNFSDDLLAHADVISENDDISSAEEMQNLREALKAIWKDDSFLKVFNDFKPASYGQELEYDATKWFKERLDAILDENYSPKNEDIVKCRSMITNVSDTSFTYNEKEFLLRDVGGQVQYRNQWKEAFAGAQIVLYIVSLDDYYKTSQKDDGEGKTRTTNRLIENRTLFKDIVNSSTMGSVPYVLIFNKTDLFKDSLKTKPLSACPVFSKAEAQRENESFDEYTERCHRYIRAYFSKVVDEKSGDSSSMQGSQDSIISVHSYFTCATDTELFKAVMEKSLIAIWKLMETRLTKAGF